MEGQDCDASHELFRGTHKIGKVKLTVKRTESLPTPEHHQPAPAVANTKDKVQSASSVVFVPQKAFPRDNTRNQAAYFDIDSVQPNPPTPVDTSKQYTLSNTPKTKYIIVGGLTSSISIEDIVAYFQSARCGGGTVTEVAYVDQSETACFVGLSGLELNSSHKLFKGTHKIGKVKLTVKVSESLPTPEHHHSAAYKIDLWMNSKAATVANTEDKVQSVPSVAIVPHKVLSLPSDSAEKQAILSGINGEESSSPTLVDISQKYTLSNTPKTNYIVVSGLTSSISIEDIVAYFQSARCGGATVTEVAYVDQSETVCFVGLSGLELTSSHKLFKGTHRFAKTKVKVESANHPSIGQHKWTVVYRSSVSHGSTESFSLMEGRPQVVQPTNNELLEASSAYEERNLAPTCHGNSDPSTPTSTSLCQAPALNYITVSGLTWSISVEDIVVYFQSARCGGGTVAEVVYVDERKTQAFVGIRNADISTSHKLFRGKHVLNHRQVNVCLATSPLPPRENSDLVAYVHEETNPSEGMLPNSSTIHANVMAVPNAHTPKTIPVQGPLHKYLLASQCQDVAAQELDENKHVQFINPPSSLHVSHNMSDTPTQGNIDGIEVTITAPKGMGANVHAAITAHKPHTDVTVTLSSVGNIVLRGRKKEVEKLKIEVERMIHDNTVTNAVTFQNQLSLPPQVLVYIEKCVGERLMNKYNIQFKTDIQTNTLEVFGTSASCTHFMTAVQSLNPSCVDVTLPAQGVSLLASPQGMALISNAIGQRPIGHYFTGPPGSVACSVAAASQLHLVAENYQDVVNIAQQLQNKIVVHQYPVPKQFFNLLSSSSWTNTCQTLETSFTALLTSHADKGIVTIACDKQHLGNVRKGLHELCEKEGFVKEIPLQKREWEHLQHSSDWTNLTAKMNSSGLQVQLPSSWDQTPAISFHGEITAVRYYAQKTKEIINNIARETRPANTQPYISVSGRQPGMGSTNHNTAACQTTLDKQSSDKTDPGNQSAHPVLNASTTRQNVGNVQPSTEYTLAAKTMDVKSIIKMKRGSLTDYQADAYVNTAHHTLNLKHGAVAQSLLRAGGPALQAECDGYIAKHGYVPEWSYAVTGGGKLPCKCVIHAVAAFYGEKRGSASAEQAMKTMVANIMAECDRLQVSSVAFPAIGAGMLGFPDNIVAKVMLQAISSYLETHTLSTLKRVLLVIFSDKAYKAFHSQYHATLSTGCTQGATSPLQSSTKPSHHISSHRVAPPQPVYHGAHTSTAPTQGQSAPLQSFVSNSITIDIIHGDITSEDCDGIVSTSSHDLTLHPFGVMGALLKKGGTELQQECTAAVKRYGHLQFSKVIVTGTGRPGGLKCRRILHIQAPYVANDLQKVVNAVLREADKERLSIVSLPAIGTGQHGFTSRVAAEGICEAIVEFSRSHPRHVKHVKVVLFQEEHYSSFSTAFTAASSKKGLSPLRSALSHVRSAITPGHGSTNSETSTVHRPPHTFPSHTKPQQTGHTQYAARNPADSKYTEDFRSPNFVYKSTEEDKPPTWDPMPTDPLTWKENSYHLVDLPPHSGEYKEVSQTFNQPAIYYKIKKIQRIQNPKLWSQYAARKKIMDRENPQGMQNERKLFHGCTEGAIQSINHSGFNASNAGRKASPYGKGMYFTRDASSPTVYSMPCQGSRHMYLARVLTGEFTTGNYTTSIPPPKNLRKDPNVLFDSVVDDIHNSRVFVVFFADQAYPEYLITYSQ